MAKKSTEAVPTTPDVLEEERSLTPLAAVWGVVARPLATFEQMRETGRGHWWVVFAVILVTVLVSVVATLPVNVEQAQREIEAQAENIPEEQQAVMEQTQEIVTSQAVLGGINFGGQIVGLAIGAAVRAGVIFLLGMALGARASFKTTWNMAVWTMLPNAARLLAMAIAVFATGDMPSAGLSAVLSGAEYREASQVLLGLLNGIDIYLVWTLFLVWVGVQATAQLNRMKSGIVTAAYWVVTLIFTVAMAAISDVFASMAVGGGPGGGPG